MDRLDREAIDWLLASDEPGIRMQARCDLLGEDPSADAAIVDTGPRVRALLEGQTQDGGFGVDVYAKWGWMARGAGDRRGCVIRSVTRRPGRHPDRARW
jgi:hypothetical protein